jgi:hypothetical protein
VRNARAYCAGAILGATLVAAAWLYTYRTWETTFIRDRGVVIDELAQAKVHPWWAVLGAYIVPLVGAGVSLWLLPEGRRLIDRFVVRVAAAFSAKAS